MPEWLYEDGIGEARAALIEDGRIVEAMIEVEGSGPRAGAIVDGRLTAIAIPARRGVVTLDGGTDLLIEPLTPRWTQGAPVRVEVVREVIAERDAVKRAKGRPADGAELGDGPTLRERIVATGYRVRDLGPRDPDAFEAAGWSELLEAAQSGVWPFTGGMLRILPTPAMTLVDVDGHIDPAELAVAAATAAARAIRALGIAGSIGIDFPTLGNRLERLTAAAAFDPALPLPFERTAINGFGFMQVVRPRVRASLIEALATDPAGHAARALLRRVERGAGSGRVSLVVHPRVAAVLAGHPNWLARLARHCGGQVALRADPGLAIWAGYADTA